MPATLFANQGQPQTMWMNAGTTVAVSRINSSLLCALTDVSNRHMTPIQAKIGIHIVVKSLSQIGVSGK